MDEAPQIKVQCTNGQCDEKDKVKTVNAGVAVGSGILLVGELACMVCGMPVVRLSGAASRG